MKKIIFTLLATSFLLTQISAIAGTWLPINVAAVLDSGTYDEIQDRTYYTGGSWYTDTTTTKREWFHDNWSYEKHLVQTTDVTVNYDTYMQQRYDGAYKLETFTDYFREDYAISGYLTSIRYFADRSEIVQGPDDPIGGLNYVGLNYIAGRRILTLNWATQDSSIFRIWWRPNLLVYTKDLTGFSQAKIELKGKRNGSGSLVTYKTSYLSIGFNTVVPCYIGDGNFYTELSWKIYGYIP
jgi:hypothetical protein